MQVERKFAPEVGNRADVVEVDRVDDAGIGHHQTWVPFLRNECVSERADVHGFPIGEGRHASQTRAAGTDHRQPLVDARVGRPAQHHHGWKSQQTRLGDVHTVLVPPPLPAYRQADHVAHGRPRNEPPVECRGQPQQISQHRHGRRFDVRRRVTCRVGRVLIECSGQPVARQCCRRAAASDEPEVARASAAGQRLIVRGEQRGQRRFAPNAL